MTPQQRKALKLALEALEISVSCTDMYYVPIGKGMIPEVEEAITAIKEALTQSEQELDYKAIGQQSYESGYSTGYMDCAVKMQGQPHRKPLTTDQMYSAIRPLFKTDALAEAALRISFDEYRAIEAAHGIKENT